MRYLAVDLGQRRTGFAVGDGATRIVTPAGGVAADTDAAVVDAVAGAVRRHEPDEVVLGLPLNMDGSEGPAAAAARRVGTMIEAATGRPVRYQDERLTTFAADQAMARSGRTRGQKKRLRDALAAAEILREFLATLPG
jgi:putative Holliday junction resolvase